MCIKIRNGAILTPCLISQFPAPQLLPKPAPSMPTIHTSIALQGPAGHLWADCGHERVDSFHGFSRHVRHAQHVHLGLTPRRVWVGGLQLHHAVPDLGWNADLLLPALISCWISDVLSLTEEVWGRFIGSAVQCFVKWKPIASLWWQDRPELLYYHLPVTSSESQLA